MHARQTICLGGVNAVRTKTHERIKKTNLATDTRSNRGGPELSLGIGPSKVGKKDLGSKTTPPSAGR